MNLKSLTSEHVNVFAFNDLPQILDRPTEHCVMRVNVKSAVTLNELQHFWC